MSAVDERRKVAGNNYEMLLANRLKDIKVVAKSAGPGSHTRQRLVDEMDEAKGRTGTVAGHMNHREPNILVHNQFLFWAGSVFILLIEAFLNKVVVDMAAQTAGGISLLVAALVSVTLVALAHWSGHLLRQVWSDSQRRILVWNVILGLLLLVVVAVAILAIMALRAYFTLVNTANVVNIFSDAVATIQEIGLDFVLRAFAVPEAATLGGLNMLALLVAFLFGFYSHDSDHQYDAALRNEGRADRRLKRQEAKYEQRLDGVHKAYKYRIERAQAAYVANQGKLTDLPVDSFTAQRAEAERETLAGAGAGAGAAVVPTKAPANVTVLGVKPAAGNPW